MNRTLLAALVLLAAFLTACASTADPQSDKLVPGPGGPDPKELPDIKLYNSSLGVGDYVVTISTAGALDVQQRHGAAANDVQRSTLQLTPDQIANLQNVFKGWKKLSASYPGDWSSLVQITYDGYMVGVHDPRRAPKQFTDAWATIDNLAKLAIANSATHPAPAPAN